MWVGLSVAQKQMCQISGRGLFGGCQGVVYRADCHLINNNGTAIEGVCVTGEAIRPDVPVVSKGRVPVASRYGAIFAITANGKS